MTTHSIHLAILAPLHNRAGTFASIIQGQILDSLSFYDTLCMPINAVN